MYFCVENVECESNFFYISGKLICFICYLKGERISSCVKGIVLSSIFYNVNIYESRVSINFFCRYV